MEQYVCCYKPNCGYFLHLTLREGSESAARVSEKRAKKRALSGELDESDVAERPTLHVWCVQVGLQMTHFGREDVTQEV